MKNFPQDTIINIDNLTIGSNKLNLSIIANQINDSGFYYKSIPLRNAYDVFLLSKKTNAKDAVNTLDKLNHPLHCFLAACSKVFNSPDSLTYTQTKQTKAYLKLFKELITNSRKAKRRHTRIKFYIHLKLILTKFYKAVIYKQYRIWLFYYIIDVKSYNKQLDIWSTLLKKNG